MKCSKNGCENEAKWEIRLSLAVHDHHEPALSTPLAKVCEEHKHEWSFDDFTPEENWNKICSGFLSAGRQAPKKKYSKLIYTEIQINPELN